MKIRKEVLAAALFTIGSSSAMAANVGSCGWGSKVFDGQSGMGPQVLAVTTNGTSGNQTFGRPNLFELQLLVYNQQLS